MMKTLKQILIVCAFTLAFSNANGQDANNPWVITLGANAVDAYPTNLPTSIFMALKENGLVNFSTLETIGTSFLRQLL